MSINRAKNRVITTAIGGPLIMIALIFITAGTLNYWQGILYTSLTMGMLALSLVVVRKDTALISERLNPGKGIKSWDKIYWRLSMAFFFTALILACLDGGRFQWSPELPLTVYIVASVVYVCGYLVFLWARTTNRYFSSVVRIQSDRGQTVCQEGPYKYIRHPGYLGGLLYTSVTPLLLGSLWALIPIVMDLAIMVVRTWLEDKTLENELAGYREYKQKVRYRILPHIW
ncbi:MAG TPA: isoprenylcysteine carboxylmethyltransferase family protein [Candidatus Acidoferrales bacterium]|nr:isoprenylcysteine carboxylmethyltransferase family protein [Candidatus Acidoferrales bacterium]